MSGISGLKMDTFGSVRVGENFIKIFCSRDEKIINLPGRSGIGVLVAGFMRVGASKKHAPLVFMCYVLVQGDLYPSCFIVLCVTILGSCLIRVTII